MIGILNGTSNYVLSRMRTGDESMDAVLDEARRLGYAEADPRADIDGDDAAAKLVVLAGIRWDATCRWRRCRGDRSDRLPLPTSGMRHALAARFARSPSSKSLQTGRMPFTRSSVRPSCLPVRALAAMMAPTTSSRCADGTAARAASAAQVPGGPRRRLRLSPICWRSQNAGRQV